MFFKKQLPPPAHFRQFVTAKESWDNVWEHLDCRPQTAHPSLRRQVIDASMEVAATSSFMLLTITDFEILTTADPRLNLTIGQERLLLECLSFASSVVCNLINSESEEYELFFRMRHSLIESFALMSLLDADEIENVALSRFELYDKSSSSTDREAYLCDAHARVLTYLANGERNSGIQIRYEDSTSLTYRIAAQKFISHTLERLKEIFSRVVQREMDEEERGF